MFFSSMLYLTDRDARMTTINFSNISLPCHFAAVPENSCGIIVSLQSSVNVWMLAS